MFTLNSISSLYTIGLLAFVISLVIGKMLFRFHLPQGLIELPDDRKMHELPTPLIGGIIIFLSSLIVLLLFNLLQDARIGIILCFSIYFFFIGLIDDILKLSYKYKLVLQLLGVIIFLFTIPFNFDQIIFSGITLNFKFWNYLIIGLWILTIINTFNFIDGINTLAGSLSIVIFISYAIFYYADVEIIPLALLIIFIFSILGFLIYNRTPAKMFLGDAGSTFLGFIITSFPIVFSSNSNSSFNLTFPFLVSFLLISDATFVIINRIIRKNSPFKPDRTHLHHSLLNLNFRSNYVVIIILISSIIHTIIAFASNNISLTWIILYLIILNSIIVILPRYLATIFTKQAS